jgi:Flp pilus assembly protein TadG
VKHRRLGQALVEFALVAPVAMLMIGATVDMGRGMVLFALLQGASRDTARQAALAYYSGSNLLAPDCTALTTPCSLTSLVQGAHLLDPLGTSVVYADSASISAAPAAYGTYLANADPTQPGTITLAGGTNPNTVYVFIYELDSTAGNPTPRWSCPTCAATDGAAVRTPGHQRAVVDLKLKWQPVMARFLGIPTVITFDAQTVVRMEF